MDDMLDVGPECSLPKDLMSMIVHCFFPTSYRHSSGNQLFDIPYNRGSDKEILTGSRVENLCLPAILDKSDDNLSTESTFADTDRMKDIGMFKKFYKTMSLEIDDKAPVFCKIKYGTPVVTGPGITGPYLNSAYAVREFRTFISEQGFFQDSKFIKQKFTEDNSSSAYSTCLIDERGESTLYDNIDYVFCIPISEKSEPTIKVKQTFLERVNKGKHYWPLNSVKDLGNLLSEQLYVIPKPDPNSKNGDLRWRLSFSVIEVELARSLNEIQRRCYRVLKALIKFNVNEGLQEDRKFPSYFLKTLFFWFCENSSEESWTAQNLGKLWLKFLDSVIESLENKKLSHYFVPAYNLLSDKPQCAIEHWLQRLKEIRKNPLEAFEIFWSKYKIPCLMEDFSLGDIFYKIIKDLKSYIVNAQRQQLGKVQQSNEFMNIASELQSKITAHFLSSYNLGDLKRFKYFYFKYNNEILTKLQRKVTYNQLSSDELRHLSLRIGLCICATVENFIWKCYKNRIQFFCVSDKSKYRCKEWRYSYSYLWTSLAEVTHHIVRKFRDNIPENDLFSTQTAEQFHLIACSIEDNNLNKLAKYANYLYVEKQYETSANLLISSCQKWPEFQRCYFSRLTCEVADVSFKLQMLHQEEVWYSESSFSYHLLKLCYTQCRVLEEVYLPERVEHPHLGSKLCKILDKENNNENSQIDQSQIDQSQIDQSQIDRSQIDRSQIDRSQFDSQLCVYKKYQLGFQYISSGQLLEAFHCFAGISDEEIVQKYIKPFSLKYAAMLYITSRLISQTFIWHLMNLF